MHTYLISYQLLFSDDSVYYTGFISRIKAYQYWAKPLKNIWLIRTWDTKETVMEKLRTTLYPSDKLLIMQVSNEWISLHLDNEVVNWMKGGL